MDYHTTKPIRERLEQLNKQKKICQEGIENGYENISSIIKHIDGEKIVLYNINYEIANLTHLLNEYNKTDSVNTYVATPQHPTKITYE